MIALVVFLTVVAMAALGVGVTRWQNADDDGARAPSPVSTPTVSPVPAGSTLQPTQPPPPYARGRVDPATGEWVLPQWSWDVLPTLAPGQEGPWQRLQATALSAMLPPVITGCEEPYVVDDDAMYREAVKRQWGCVHDAWKPALERLGLSTMQPPVKFFTGAGTTSACGYTEAPAFYCPGEGGTVYFGGDDRDVAMYYDLTINESVHHEYAHHIQNLTGVIGAMEEITFTGDLDRRLELQATCLSASMTFHNTAVDFDQIRWDDWQFSLSQSEIDDVHGSPESLLYWGTRGLYAQTLGDCNTWTVEPGRVS